MAYIPSERTQVKDGTGGNVVPDSVQIPAAHTDFLKIVNAIEPRLVMRLASLAEAEVEPTSIAPLENGMWLVTTSSPYEVYYRVAGAWKKVWPVVYNGTAAPAASLGVEDDLYIQYV